MFVGVPSVPLTLAWDRRALIVTSALHLVITVRRRALASKPQQTMR